MAKKFRRIEETDLIEPFSTLVEPKQMKKQKLL